MKEKIKNANTVDGLDDKAKIDGLSDITRVNSRVTNGLADALGIDDQKIAQLSKADTLFKNLRYYTVSNFRNLLSQIYVEIGLVSTIIDVPAEDALRGGIDIVTSQLSEEEIEELKSKMDQENDLQKACQAIKWNSLYGGAGIIPVTDQDPQTPFDIESINEKTKLSFKAVDMWELYTGEIKDQDDRKIRLLDGENDESFYNYYGIKIHSSRVMVLKGLEAPSFVKPRLRGWGLSRVEILVRSINQYIKGTDLMFELLDEYKVDTYKIKGLTSTLMSDKGTEKIHHRLTVANAQKNYQNALVMDGEDDYIQKQYNFAGISEAFTGIRQQVSADMRMPMTKIFGVSSAGFNSGEDDIENYNAMVESSIRSKIKGHLMTMVKIRARQMFGVTLDDLKIDFEPLRVLSATQEEEVKTSLFNRAMQAVQGGFITSDEFRDILNKKNLLDTQLEDTDVSELVASKKETAKVDSPKKPNLGIDAPSVPSPKNSYDSAYTFKGRRVAVVGVISGNEILTGKRRDTGKYTFTGGHIDEGESPQDGAVREVFEESGIRLLRTDLQEVYNGVINDHEGNKIALFAYIAKIPKQDATSRNDPDNEVEKWEWIPMHSNQKGLRDIDRNVGSEDVILAYLKENDMLPKKKFFPF